MINLLEHPLVSHNLVSLRNSETDCNNFRVAAKKLGYFLAIDLLSNLKTKPVTFNTPNESCEGDQIGEKVILMPILRAGLLLLEPFLEIYPDSVVGYYGVKRNEETLEPNEYYYSMPEFDELDRIIILDPMIATGGSACAAIARLQLDGATNISIAALIAAPEGVEKILTEFPSVSIYCTALDRGLNERGYIVPGLGDAGDRMNNTIV
ncbi:MAG: uracil phosphoribosyltransferase [Candidatus Kapabacteria bacterium]|nr:uracil phosphoribosyltransferase [Candidatus Kapabacteria bacterium]